MPYDPNNPQTKMIGGKLYMWQPDTSAAEQASYLGKDAPEVDQTPGVGPGSWVPASYKNENGISPAKIIALMAAAGTGGQALVDYGVPAIASLFSGGGAAATPAAAQAAAAAPEAAGAVGLPAAAAGGGTGIGASSLAAGNAGIANAVTAGLASESLPAAVAGLPASVLGPTGAGATTLAASGSAAAVPAAVGTASTLSKVLKGVGEAGQVVGAADKAAAANRSESDDYALRQAALELQNNQLGLNGFNANTTAQSALERELIDRATLEGTQRKTDLSNIYKQSVAQNPARSPYDPKGPPTLSQAYMDALAALSKQGGDELAQAPAYSARNMATLTPRTYTPPAFTPPTQKKPGTLEQVGNWLGPLLAGVGAFA